MTPTRDSGRRGRLVRGLLVCLALFLIMGVVAYRLSIRHRLAQVFEIRLKATPEASESASDPVLFSYEFVLQASDPKKADPDAHLKTVLEESDSSVVHGLRLVQRVFRHEHHQYVLNEYLPPDVEEIGAFAVSVADTYDGIEKRDVLAMAQDINDGVAATHAAPHKAFASVPPIRHSRGYAVRVPSRVTHFRWLFLVIAGIAWAVIAAIILRECWRGRPENQWET